VSQPQDVVPEDVRQALDIAKRLIDAGIPVFSAPPCPAAEGGQCSIPGHGNGKTEYHLPPKWQTTVPAHVWLERWQPGWALAAVGGHAADFLDIDPRNGGEASEHELQNAHHLPRIYAEQETPSGGRHLMIAPLGERKGELLPGIDYQGGAPDGQGRGFVWIAPTVKRAKDGSDERRPYRWLQEPDTNWLAEGGDTTGEMIVARLQAMRAKPEKANDERAVREFTEAEARAFCNLTLEKLSSAEIGQIEERANAAAVQLSHFVPDFWSEEFAFTVLMSALEETAYDPDGPSSWTAEKFHAVLAGEGNRAPDDWKAVRRPEPGEPLPEPDADEVEALIAEMKSPDDLVDLPPPRHLVYGLLTLDSESWIIGEPGSRKSFVALDIAAHVARGLPWQELEVEKGRVVFIVAEGAAAIGSRMKAWQKVYGAVDPDKEKIFRTLTRPVQASNRKAWSVLVEACRRIDPVLVVIDTQARVTVGLKENDATDMGYYIEAVRAIREATGACVLTIHHTGRTGGDARGSSAIDGAQTTELKVEASKTPLRGVLKVEKQKDLEEHEDIPLKFEVVEVGTDEKARPITSLVLCGHDAWARDEIEPEEEPDWRRNLATNQIEVLEAVEHFSDPDGASPAQIRAWINEERKSRDRDAMAKTSVDSALKALLLQGHLEKPTRGTYRRT
jgi:hypothetical protein